MKRTLFAAVISGIITIAAPITSSHASMATDLSTKVAEKIVGAVLGEGASQVMSAIFGGGAQGLTKADVENAINQAFEKANTQDIEEKKLALANQVSIYDPEDTDAASSAREIANTAGDLQAKVGIHISKNNSLVAIPAFITAWNTRLTFLAERYRLDPTAAKKHLLATETIKGLSYLDDYLRNDFRDNIRGTSPCIKKDTNTHLRLNGAVGMNVSEKNVDISTWYCYGNGRVVKNKLGLAQAKAWHHASDENVVNLGGASYMRTTDMFKAMHEDLWLFAGRTTTKDNVYYLEQSPSEEFAYMLRNQYILNKYPSEMGNLRNTVIAWVDIVKATHNPTTPEMNTALKHAAKLGVGWNALAERYKHNNALQLIENTIVPAIRRAGEKRSILD